MGKVRLELCSRSQFHFDIPEEAIPLLSVGPISSTCKETWRVMIETMSLSNIDIE
jgi:hypothetical protein